MQIPISRRVAELVAVLHIAGIDLRANRFHQPYLLFRELGALAVDVLVRPNGAWAREPLELVATANNRYVLMSVLACCVAVSASSTIAWSTTLQGAPWKSEVVSSRTIHVSGASIRIDFAPGAVDITQDVAVTWIRAAATAVAAYYGRFPLTRARVLVMPVADRSGVLGGTTWGDAGGYPGFTTIRLGQHTNEEQLGSDWVMTHEFVHMAFPSLPDDQHWLEEGLATYIEPIARGQRGMLSEASIWNEMVRNMPKRNSQASDHGLNHTHTWASTYWGGALFCLVADVTIRKRTGNRRGLQDALRGIVAMQGTIDKEWPTSKVLAIGDDATGTSVLSDLYRAMGDTPGDIDLDSLWKELGVVASNDFIVFDDAAPSAEIRKSITHNGPEHSIYFKEP